MHPLQQALKDLERAYTDFFAKRDQAPQLPLDWTAWTFWQYSQGGSVAGVAGQVDLDRFNGDHNRFQTLLIQPSAPSASSP